MTTKKAPKSQELSVEEKLQNLYELQRIDTAIDKIKTLRGELPLEVQDLEDEIIGLETRVSNLKNEIEEADQSITLKKQEIGNSEGLIKKYSEQLNNVRNNREYDALNKEVEFQKLEIELQQKRIREATKVKAEKEEALENASKLFEEKKTDLQAKKDELNDIINETHKEEEELGEKSKQLSQNIDERLLTAYERIRSNARNGLAVVTVDRDSCGGCFNNIPPQRQLDIRSRKKVIVCEYCGRILIDKYICDYDGSMQKADLEAAMGTQVKKGRRKKTDE
ncbi:C4-type zinc ribbon domain-containing protein [Porphyromonadaceae bacterium OttesenSCG-928-L07]|nr:C4-type zinc ribbon domain-containing protein [Porphyromonadaceae bacterium OttesenSCG-928-L07]MDL2251902.1 C4-type zinc ribbon domain-containing protein [Odoribacter sp. OttesenSCG-928-J03]